MKNYIATNPKLYEINTRVWIKQFGEQTKLSGIPTIYFENLVDKGINIIWLMGIWKTCDSIIEKSCFTPDLVSAYNKALSNWKKEDVIGSPYAIDEYIINPRLGTVDDLLKLKEKLNSLGLKLFLDFVPNHFNADTKYLKTNPEFFLNGDEEMFSKDPFTFFKSSFDETKIFAHGRDPFFPVWEDTVQVNYSNEETRNFMTSILLGLSEVCDGVRCDMAMLELNNVFENTWLGVLNKQNYSKPKKEFWSEAISKVKAKNPGFIFLAEVYWDLEWQLQQNGFDYTYDKRLTDRLASKAVLDVKAHLNAEKSFQLKSVRFLENHDEERAVERFGMKESLAGSVLISTIQGMRFYYDGQFEGKKIKLPVQLGSKPVEKPNLFVKEYYDRLLSITKEKIFQEGNWQMLNALPVSHDNFSFENIFTWQWQLQNETRIIAINYSGNTSQCRLKFEVKSNQAEILLIDLLNKVEYIRSISEIKTIGLFIELKSYQSHIFKFSAYIK
ncbi:MAG: alpha-amylase family glycosyl hydrolase [Ignavibacteriaceae bacterium]